MKCLRCGAEMSHSRFCGQCGAPRPRRPASFETTEEQFAALKTRYDAGQLSDAAYDAALHQLVIHGEDGAAWMIGAESGEWYTYDGAAWVRSDPPTLSDESVAPPPQGRPEPPVSPSPAPAPVRSGRAIAPRLALAAGVLLGLCAVCAVSLLIASDSLFSWIVRQAPQQGWPIRVMTSTPLVIVVTPEPTRAPVAAASDEPTRPVPTSVAAVTPAPPRTAPPSSLPTMTAEAKIKYVPVPASGRVALASPSVNLELPVGWWYADLDGMMLFCADPNAEELSIELSWYRVQSGATAESELERWMAFHSNRSWTAVQAGKNALGPLASATGTEPGFRPFYFTFNGPVQGWILWWSHQPTPAQVTTDLPVMQQMVERATLR